METFCAYAHPSWGITEETSCGPATGGKLPMGLAVGPRTGANVVVTGDASGTVNPFNGEGISYGYETGRLAAAALAQALIGGGGDALRDYDAELDAAYGDYYRVARVFVRVISDPRVMALCVGAGMRSQWLMEEILRLMSNLFRPEHRGAAEVGYDALEGLTRVLPAGLAEKLLISA
jgi:flavin-dependent dehydrogenase